MKRRAFISGIAVGLIAAPLAAEAQQARTVYKIGYLASGLSSVDLGGKRPFRQGLHDLGYVEGRDFVMESRWAEGHPEQATKTIPIVFGSAGNVVEKGIVASLARPGGNVTGLTFQLGYLKLYQLLKEAAPRVVRGVYLYDPESNTRDVAERLRSLAQAEKVEWQSVALRNDPNGVAQAFAEFGRGRNGLLLDNSNPLQLKADQICGLALQRRIPAVGRERTFADAGCLMSYAENPNEMYRRAAGLVDRILRGAKPAELPVEMPTKFELVINLKTAKALGLTIPQSLLLRADELIQ